METPKSIGSFIQSWMKRIMAIRMLGGVCTKCKQNNLFTLEFHHAGDKEVGISQMRGYRWSKIKKEAKKCTLLCRNCHAELHYDEGGDDRQRSLLKLKLLEYKDVYKCEECGYAGRNYRSLEFHHKDPETKKFEIIDEIWKTRRREKNICDYIMKEIDGCEVICRNCHGIKHTNIEKFKRFESQIYDKIQTYKELIPVDNKTVLKMHGDGIKNADIARRLHCAKSSITYILKNHKSAV